MASAKLVVQAVASGLVSAWFGPAPRLPANAIGWIVVSNLLTAGILALIALRSSQRGAGLAVRLAAVFFGVSTFNNMIEALFFHVVSAGEFVRYLLQGALTAFPFSFALVGLLGLRRAERPGPSPGVSVWRQRGWLTSPRRRGSRGAGRGRAAARTGRRTPSTG